MEATVGCGKDKRGSKDERDGPSLGFGSHFGSCSSTPTSSPPHKLFRTAAFPFRMEQPPVCFSGCTLHPSTLNLQVAAALQVPLRTGWPFTSAQWQELQRQALIYKHLMSSVPVPSDLLQPISARSFPSSPNLMSVAGGCYTLRLGNKIDPEPGRCRRTDGKKWRCSNEVALEQKYCERHMHRGRPRSRKPVELKDKPNSTKTLAGIEEMKPKTLPLQPSPVFIDSSKEPRKYESMGRGEEVAPKNQWGNMNPDIDSSFQLNLNYTNLNTHCSPYEDGGFGDHGRTPRSFIDAWSTEVSIPTITTSTADKMPPEERKLPLSTLSLSMPSGIEWIDMGLGSRNYPMDVKEPQVNWMGGPLAEVLGRSSNALPSPNHSGGLIDLMSKSSYEASPQESPARASPSGVLQKTLVSLSDSSSCSSPTFGSGAAKTEIALQWFK